LLNPFWVFNFRKHFGHVPKIASLGALTLGFLPLFVGVAAGVEEIDANDSLRGDVSKSQ